MSNENDKLVNLLITLTEKLDNITEYGKNELKGISILSMNPYMRRFFCNDIDYETIKTDIQIILQEIKNNPKDVSKELVESLLILVKMFDDTRNLSYVDNKKHLKRKFEKTLSSIIKEISQILGVNQFLEMFKQNQFDLSNFRLSNLKR